MTAPLPIDLPPLLPLMLALVLSWRFLVVWALVLGDIARYGAAEIADRCRR